MPRRKTNLGRRSRSAERARRRRANMTEEDRAAIREINRLNRIQIRNSESAERRAARLEAGRLRARRERSSALARSKQNERERAFLASEMMRRKRCLEQASWRWHNKSLAIKETAGQRQQLFGDSSQHVTNIKSESTGNVQTSYSPEKSQKCFDFSESMTIIPVSMIKKEIIDPSEQNEELILPDYPQYTSSVDFINAVETEINDSSKIEQRLLLPNIKIEPTDDDVYEPSGTGEPSENILNSKSGNFVAFGYELTKCSVLLHDCLIPENLASITSEFKSLKINKDISEAYPKSQVYTFKDSPFFSHCSDAYKDILPNISLPKKAYMPRYCRVALKWNDYYLKKKKASSRKISSKKVSSKNVPPKKANSKKEKLKAKNICNCNNAIPMGTELNEYNVVSAQQLCSCVTSDSMLSESTKLEEVSLFYPDFGKISSGINNI